MRGKAFVNLDNFAAAIPDFSEWNKRDPKDGDPYLWRGIANLYTGALPNSLADIDQVTTIAPKWAYGPLWLDIVDRRSNLPSRVQQATAQLDMTAWPAPILKFFLGQLTPEAVEAAADNSDAARAPVSDSSDTIQCKGRVPRPQLIRAGRCNRIFRKRSGTNAKKHRREQQQRYESRNGYGISPIAHYRSPHRFQPPPLLLRILHCHAPFRVTA